MFIAPVAKELDIILVKGGCLDLVVLLCDLDGVPLDLTGYTFTGWIKQYSGDEDVAKDLVCAVLVPAVDGKISVRLAASDVMELDIRASGTWRVRAVTPDPELAFVAINGKVVVQE